MNCIEQETGKHIGFNTVKGILDREAVYRGGLRGESKNTWPVILHQSLNNTETILEKAVIIGQKLIDSGGFFMSVDGPIERPEQQVSGVLLARFVTSTLSALTVREKRVVVTHRG